MTRRGFLRGAFTLAPLFVAGPALARVPCPPKEKCKVAAEPLIAPPGPYDDHEVHVHAHLDELRMMRAAGAAHDDPLSQALMKHIAQHLDLLMEDLRCVVSS